jgi:hypothetical protein
MSDYLRNLAARTVNLADVIQPRRASRFEPTPVHGALGLRTAVPSLTDVPEMTEPAAQASIRPRSAQRAEPQTAPTDEQAGGRSRLTQTQPLSPTVQEASTVPVPAQSGAEAQSETRPEPQPPLRLALPSVPSVAPTLSALPQAPPLLSSAPQPPPPLAPIPMRPGMRAPALDVTAPSAASQRQPMLQPIIASIIAREVMERRTAPSVQRREQPPSIERRTAPSAQGRGQQPSSDDTQVIVVQSRIMPVERRGEDSRDSGPLPLSVQAPPPAPTIHVTIGRVEVRATTPAVPASKPRPAPRTMSLDDYLRQRSRGGKP